MAQVVKLKRSSVEGKVPTTSNLELGELSINTRDGRAFLKKYDGSNSIEHLVTTNSQTTGSIELVGNITASGDISASGNLYAGLTENSSDYNTVVYNNTTGQFFYTGSYGGSGGSISPVGPVGTIQYSNGSGELDGSQSDLSWTDSSGTFRIGSTISLQTLPPQNPGFNYNSNCTNNMSLRNKGLIFSNNVNYTGSFANFESKKGNFMLYPPHILNNTLNSNTLSDINNPQVGSDGIFGTSRLHVIDTLKNHTAKIINLNSDSGGGASTLLLGTKYSSNFGNSITPPFKFIDFQVGCGVHEGTSIGGIYYDPYGSQFNSNPNSVVYQGQFVQGSDRKLKKNITNTKKGIKDIMSMKVKDYRWKSNPKTSLKSIGLIAQDLQETHPELVTTLNDTLNVDYTGIVPILIKAMQDQQKQIDDLKNQLKRNKK